VGGLSDLWGFLADEAEVLLELSWGVEGLLALVALVSACVWELAVGASAHDESVGEPEVAVGAVALGHFLLGGFLLVVDAEEDLLGYS